MFGNGNVQGDMILYNKILNQEFLLFFTLGILSATGIVIRISKWLDVKFESVHMPYLPVSSAYRIFQSIYFIGVLIICSVYLITNTYNPFIYYRF